MVKVPFFLLNLAFVLFTDSAAPAVNASMRVGWYESSVTVTTTQKEPTSMFTLFTNDSSMTAPGNVTVHTSPLPHPLPVPAAGSLTTFGTAVAIASPPPPVAQAQPVPEGGTVGADGEDLRAN
jgi:hypothetical protein